MTKTTKAVLTKKANSLPILTFTDAHGKKKHVGLWADMGGKGWISIDSHMEPVVREWIAALGAVGIQASMREDVHVWGFMFVCLGGDA